MNASSLKLRLVPGSRSDGEQVLDVLLADVVVFTETSGFAGPEAQAAAVDRIVEEFPTLDRSDVESQLAKLVQANPAEPWPVPVPLDARPDLPEFPLDQVFTDGLQEIGDFAEAVAAAYQVPVDLVVCAILSITAACLMQRVRLEVATEWDEQVPVWTLILLPSGTRKSPVIARLLRPINAWAASEIELARPDLAKWKARSELREQKIRELRTTAAKERDAIKAAALTRKLEDLAAEAAIDKPPPRPDLIATEATSEGLGKMLSSNGERVLICAAEADALDVLLGRYSDAPNLGVCLAGYSGERYHAQRKMSGNTELDRPLVTMALVVQPSAVRALLTDEQAKGRGFLARFMFCVPVDSVGHRSLDSRPVPAALSEVYGQAVTRMLSWRSFKPNEPLPVLALTPEAAAALRAFRAAHEPRMARDGDLFEMREWASKEVGNLCRIALVMECLATALKDGHAPPSFISAATMRQALALAPYFEAHARAAEGTVGMSRDVALARRLMKWIRQERRTHFGLADAARGLRPHTQRVEQLLGPAGLLTDLGWLRQADVSRHGPGRRPAPAFEVNPALFDGPPPEPHTPRPNGPNGANDPKDLPEADLGAISSI